MIYMLDIESGKEQQYSLHVTNELFVLADQSCDQYWNQEWEVQEPHQLVNCFEPDASRIAFLLCPYLGQESADLYAADITAIMLDDGEKGNTMKIQKVKDHYAVRCAHCGHPTNTRDIIEGRGYTFGQTCPACKEITFYELKEVASSCNCENMKCHPKQACTNAGVVRIDMLGLVCIACAVHYDSQYHIGLALVDHLACMFAQLNETARQNGETVVSLQDTDYYADQIKNIFNASHVRAQELAQAIAKHDRLND